MDEVNAPVIMSSISGIQTSSSSIVCNDKEWPQITRRRTKRRTYVSYLQRFASHLNASSMNSGLSSAHEFPVQLLIIKIHPIYPQKKPA